MAVAIHPLPANVRNVPPPARFTYPFCYEPHPLCIAAADEVRRYLAQRPEWHDELQRGKMFGVLVVEKGFLAAFSGTLDGKTQHEYFVPPVFDLMAPGCYFQEEEAAISSINRQIETLRGSLKPSPLRAKMAEELASYKEQMRQHKAERDRLRQDPLPSSPEGEAFWLFGLFGRASSRRPSIAASSVLGKNASPQMRLRFVRRNDKSSRCRRNATNEASPCSSGCSVSLCSSMPWAKRSRCLSSFPQLFLPREQASVVRQNFCRRLI